MTAKQSRSLRLCVGSVLDWQNALTQYMYLENIAFVHVHKNFSCAVFCKALSRYTLFVFNHLSAQLVLSTVTNV